jgi:endonuclease/exonuclease/phosphatase family metal-dependent hydrolase
MKSKTTDGVVIGGDMNNNPDNFKDGFTIFENAGYKILDPKVPTNANHIDQKCGYPLRTIDFIFSSTKPLLASIWSLFFGAFTVTASEAKVLEGFDFTIDSNCSDHLPVVSTITITKEESMITRLLRALSSIFPSAR